MPSIASLLVLALTATTTTLLTAVNADVYVTNPIASYSGVGGQTITVQWVDDGDAPLLSTVSTCSIDLYTGSIKQQTFLQNLGESVDVSKASSVTTVIDADVGPDGPYYFVRFTSADLKDTTNPQWPHQAFSARFTMTGMTGSFNETILAQIASDSSLSGSKTPTSSSTVTSQSTTARFAAVSTSSRSITSSASASASASRAAAATTSAATSASTPRARLQQSGLVGIVAMGVFVGAFGVALGVAL